MHHDFDSMTDEEIALLAQQGDADASEYLLNKYKNFVRSKARSYFLVGADHEDIVQEGMIGLFKAFRDFRPDKLASFHAFAEICVTRQIITAIKTATRQKHIPLNSYVSLNKPIYEEESDLFYEDRSDSIIEDDVLVRLISMPNVIVTSHQAFLTREALNNIAATTVDNLLKFKRGEAASDTEVCYRCVQ